MVKVGPGAGGLTVGIHSSQQDMQESAHVTLLNNCLEFNLFQICKYRQVLVVGVSTTLQYSWQFNLSIRK